MLDGEETVQIACGKLRWEGARQYAGRTGNRANSLGKASLGGSRRERDSMLDGKETVQIAWGELRWEGARQHAGRRGNCANSLGKASLGGSETVCWTERERDSMLDGQETVQIAWGELRWEGARQHAGRIGNRANSLGKASLGGSETGCWTERKPCK